MPTAGKTGYSVHNKESPSLAPLSLSPVEGLGCTLVLEL